MSTAIVTKQFIYNNNVINVNLTQNGAWINATPIAKAYGKRLDGWMGSTELFDYIVALNKTNGIYYDPKILGRKKIKDLPNIKDYVYTIPNGLHPGTWIHPKLAVIFARWIDADFAVWCDIQIQEILNCGNSPMHNEMQTIVTELSLLFNNQFTALQARSNEMQATFSREIEELKRLVKPVAILNTGTQKEFRNCIDIENLARFASARLGVKMNKSVVYSFLREFGLVSRNSTDPTATAVSEGILGIEACPIEYADNTTGRTVKTVMYDEHVVGFVERIRQFHHMTIMSSQQTTTPNMLN